VKEYQMTFPKRIDDPKVQKWLPPGSMNPLGAFHFLNQRKESQTSFFNQRKNQRKERKES